MVSEWWEAVVIAGELIDLFGYVEDEVQDWLVRVVFFRSAVVKESGDLDQSGVEIMARIC